jgi:hypothetical protein
MAEAEALPLVVHCTAGRDRTGVVAALLLGCLGVPVDDIVADYSATAGRRDQLLEFLCRRTDYADLPDGSPLLDTRPEVMARFLFELRDQGGPTGWALAAGLDPETLHRLRDRLLETRPNTGLATNP